MADIDTKNH